MYPKTLTDSLLKVTLCNNPDLSLEGDLMPIFIGIQSIPLCTDFQGVLTQGLFFWEKDPKE